jgi:hypothetical protein
MHAVNFSSKLLVLQAGFFTRVEDRLTYMDATETVQVRIDSNGELRLLVHTTEEEEPQETPPGRYCTLTSLRTLMDREERQRPFVVYDVIKILKQFQGNSSLLDDCGPTVHKALTDLAEHLRDEVRTTPSVATGGTHDRDPAGSTVRATASSGGDRTRRKVESNGPPEDKPGPTRKRRAGKIGAGADLSFI